jgi:hypothetical protein
MGLRLAALEYCMSEEKTQKLSKRNTMIKQKTFKIKISANTLVTPQ